MTPKTLRSAAIALLCCSSLLPAQEKGSWRAASTTAKSITGDVAFAGQKLIINFAAFTIAQLRELTPDEVSAAFNADRDGGGTGNLYRLEIPADRRFLHKNTLCGSEDTQYMATYVLGHNLQIAFFSGAKMPTLSVDALANATNLCGTFSYVR